MRSTIYHRRGCPWRAVIRALHRLGYSDRQIAGILPDLSRASMLRLAEEGWTCKLLESLLTPGVGQPGWTERQVRYHRTQMDLPARLPDRSALKEARAQAALGFAAESGWGHLVGRSRELADLLGDDLGLAEAASELGSGWTESRVRAWIARPWEVLWPMECLTLTALAHEQPQTLTGLQASLGQLLDARRLTVPGRRKGEVSYWMSSRRLQLLLARDLIRQGPPQRRYYIDDQAADLIRPGYPRRRMRQGPPARSYLLAEGLTPHEPGLTPTAT